MTVMGKILVFLILALALVQAALHIMFHVTQTNWQKGYEDMAARAKSADTDALQFRTDLNEERDKFNKEIAEVRTELKKVNDSLAQEQGKTVELNKQLVAERDSRNKGDAQNASAQIGSQRRQEEVKRLEDTLKARDDRVKELVDSNNALRDRAVAAEIESKTLKERNGGLVAKLEEMTKENIKIRNGTAAGTLSAKNPPPENIEGLVTKTDSSGLLTLSIGSDDGLAKGHTLEVFRLSPAKYLGTVRIISVTPHEAVAQPVSHPLGSIQQGDRVASKIL
jgi:hypothetical protein